MLAILVSKWVADAISHEGVYDLAQNIMGHPFLHADGLLVDEKLTARDLCPPEKTMDEITVEADDYGNVEINVLREKLKQLLRRGLLDAGLAIVKNGILKGYLAEGELQTMIFQVSWTKPRFGCIKILFAKIGLRALCVVDEGVLLGVIVKKRLLQFSKQYEH